MSQRVPHLPATWENSDPKNRSQLLLQRKPLPRGPTAPRFAHEQNRAEPDLCLPGLYFTFGVRLEPIGF